MENFKSKYSINKKILDLIGKSYYLIGIQNEDQLHHFYCRLGKTRYTADYSKLTRETGCTPKMDFDKDLEIKVERYLRKTEK